MISPVYTGMKRFFLEGKETTEGMPAYANTLKSFLAQGWEIHLIVISNCHIAPPLVKGLFTYECHQRAGRRGIVSASLKAFKTGLRLARRHNFDLIYGHGEYSAVAGMLALLLRIPNVRRIYGTFLYRELYPARPWRRIRVAVRHPLLFLAFALPTEGLIITNDGSRGAEVARALGCPSDRIHSWLNGVDHNATQVRDQAEASVVLKKHNIPYGRPLIISVSRLEKWKGVDRAIRCLKYVEHKPMPVLLIVGDGSQMTSLRRLAVEEGVSQDILFLGSLSHEETMCLIGASDISLSLYDYSNLGNVLIESMALGMCIVSLADGSLDGIITSGENGILLDSADPQTMADTIDRLLCDCGLMRRMGVKARESASQLFETWEARMDKELRLIDTIIAGKKETSS